MAVAVLVELLEPSPQLIVPLNESLAGAAQVKVAVKLWPACILSSAPLFDVTLRLQLGGATVPVPVRLAICGLPAPLSVTASEAVRRPVPAGLNIMLIMQAPSAGTLVPQVLVWAKSALFVPTIAMLEIESAAVPPFVSAIICAELPLPSVSFAKFRLVGERPTVTDGFTVRINVWTALLPTPLVAVIVILNGLPVAEAGVPLSTPVAALNVTPLGNAPVSLSVGVGKPVAVTMNVPAVPTANVVLFVLVIAGACGVGVTVRVAIVAKVP